MLISGEYMSDYISIKKVWQDIDLIKITFECKTKHIYVNNDYYTCFENIDNLLQGLNCFLFGHQSQFFWENGERGNNSVSCFSLNFSYKDSCGHILIEVFMEIDDGGSLEKHNCCFFVSVEFGQLSEFYNKLHNFRESVAGTTIVLGKTD